MLSPQPRRVSPPLPLCALCPSTLRPCVFAELLEASIAELVLELARRVRHAIGRATEAHDVW